MELMEKRPSGKTRKQTESPVAAGKSPSASGQFLSGGLLKPNQRLKDILIRPMVDDALAPIVARATEVIGDRDEALRWLGTPVRGLGYSTPISLLGTKEGAERVDDILGQMQHGIW
jgi:Antitoxin Xre/MbcA/ParS C-terminal toxin-binding domain